MANRYWVGGTGSWDGTATHWSATSGGGGGATVPTAADDVFFDNLSNATLYTCTVSSSRVCRSLSIAAPASGNITFAGSISTSLAISGSLAIASTGVTRTYTGGLTFKATTTGWTVSAGVSLASAITFDGAGGGWTLTAGLTTTGTLTFSAGTFSTGANYSLSVGILDLGSIGARTVTLNASSVSCTGIYSTSLTNLTFNAGTSTVTCSATSFTLFAPNLTITFYNFVFSSNFTTITLQNLTFTNLTFPAKSAIGLTQIVLATIIIVTGTLTIPAPTILGSYRYFIRSDTYGTQRIFSAATRVLTDVDFQDINSNSTWTGTRIGDAGGNSGITFTTGVAKYWNLVAGGVITGLGWALSSGGTPSAANFPLPQDTMTFVNTGLNTSATVTLVLGYNSAGFDCSARTLAMTVAFPAAAIAFYGSVTLSTAVTVSGSSGTFYFSNRGAITITSAGKSWLQGIVFNGIGGTYTLGDNLTLTGDTITLNYGTLILNAQTLRCQAFIGTGTSTRALTMGSGAIEVTGFNTVWDMTDPTGMTLTAGTSTITLSLNPTSNKTFIGGDLTYNNLVIGGTGGIATLTFTGSNTFTGTISSTRNLAHTILFTAGTTTTVANWTVAGTAGNVVTIGSATAASHNLVKTGGGNISIDYMSISQSHASP